MRLFWVWGAIVCVFVSCQRPQLPQNPFSLSLDDLKLDGKELTFSNYVEIQKRIQSIDITEILKDKYIDCQEKEFTHFQDFWNRCTKSLRQILIDPEKGHFPQKKLVQIGKGGGRCVVCAGSFNGKYPSYIDALQKGLQETGFNGHLLYYIGGWPNPTGQEIRFVSVPYCFKVFAMVEAKQLGFNQVLWVDSACYPLRNIEPLFDILERDGALLNWSRPKKSWKYIFPSTVDALKQITGVNVIKTKFINSIVMGLKMDTPQAEKFVQKYYEMAELGFPFLSCYPEEFVFTSIINDGNYPSWVAHKPPKLIKSSLALDSPEEAENQRKQGIFFYHRKER